VNLRGITITGADDQVDPLDLVDLSDEFPLVEWGVLRSEKRRGTPRYPSDKWIHAFNTALRGLRSSHHLCGSYARAALSGSAMDADFASTIPVASRVQLNGYTQFVRNGGALKVWPVALECFAVILQCTDADAVRFADLSDSDAGSEFQTLYDPSGGRGHVQLDWPNFGRPCGYAGGIGPSNVARTIRQLETFGVPYWIDMESGVRTDDRFDLGKVRLVLERAYRAAEMCS
jgi:hypothetical protein